MLNFRLTDNQKNEQAATICCLVFENHDGDTINLLNSVLAYRYNLDASQGVGGNRDWVRSGMLRKVVTAIHECPDCEQYGTEVKRLAAENYVDNFLIECDLGNWDENE